MLNKLVILNIALLIGHQIDAAFWHEWDMFALPGGIQLFNVLNVIIFAVVLGCLSLVIQRRPGGYAAALFIALSGAIVLPIHAGFAANGFEQFNLPVSIALIVGGFIIALLQALVTVRSRHEFTASGGPR